MSSSAVKRESINENVALRENVQQYTNEIAKLKNETLNQDRRFYYEETITLKEENARLQATITRLEMANVKYEQIIDKFQQSKSDQMAAVQSIRSMTSAEQDKEFITKFSLPEGEFSIIAYSCTNDSFLSGMLHITPFYICFEPTGLLAHKESIWSIPIKEIKSLNKIKAIKFLPGKGTSVEILTSDGKMRLLKNFLRRKECLRNIYNQGQTIGHTVEMLRENLPDTNQLPK
ncbi:hypothetical protein PPL_09996 [Heterostelium album PN500]|uniref:GRAM domain-containing protein n=1 Tax=Heterostelium pallidum (strain ATCC 26659 / Pp 5 / PN500) TaxID=670386 RepID=D3BPV2_HETP5|nr:hypothetical protein PPL_09996 [Heterostelium album PN500]EFA76235.1 hypothetical protein PPL_09996 [Heterostelium album PN500]|eukprot:XP_020428368.1 hypothetical protein PPL_09996 [Heterostelium album PN500]